MSKVNPQWITLVLITAVMMLVFLVFYGYKAPAPTSQEKEELRKVQTEEQALPTENREVNQ